MKKEVITIELTGKIIGLDIDIITNKTKLTLEVNEKQNAIQLYDDLRQENKLSIEIAKHREKRSLDANAYAWVLITKISNALRTSKDECYLTMLKRYGQGGVAKIPNKYASDFKRTFKYIEKHETLPDEENAQYYRFWVGSSQYNTEEMSILIDGIVSEAKDMGIETRTPEQIAEMLSLWGSE